MDFLDQLLVSYKFYGSAKRGILFFNYASCELLNRRLTGAYLGGSLRAQSPGSPKGHRKRKRKGKRKNGKKKEKKKRKEREKERIETKKRKDRKANQFDERGAIQGRFRTHSLQR